MDAAPDSPEPDDAGDDEGVPAELVEVSEALQWMAAEALTEGPLS